MIRENLSPHIISEQFALDSFESGSALEERDQFGYGTLPRKMDHQAWQITNKNLLTRWRYMELMHRLNQVTVEFEDPNELSRLFARMGVNTRSGNIYDLYWEQDNLLCNYCYCALKSARICAECFGGSMEQFLPETFNYAWIGKEAPVHEQLSEI